MQGTTQGTAGQGRGPSKGAFLCEPCAKNRPISKATVENPPKKCQFLGDVVAFDSYAVLIRCA